MTSRPAAPVRMGSLDDALKYVEFLEAERNELRTALSLAQTEIKGHMRIEDALKADLRHATTLAVEWTTIATEAQARVAELEKALARLGSMEAFKGPRFVTENDTELIARIDFARAALKDRA